MSMSSVVVHSDHPAIDLYNRFFKLVNYLRPLFLLLLRLVIGYQCAMAGYAHFRFFNKTAQTFATDYHLPMAKLNVLIAAGTELIGGILLMAGFASRLISIPLMINFTVAIIVSNIFDPDYGPLIRHFWNHQDVIIKDAAFPFLSTALIVFLFGPGCFSVDHFIKMHIKKKHQAERGFEVAPAK